MLLTRSSAPILPLDRPWETGGTPCAVGAFLEPETGAVRLYYLVRFNRDPRQNMLCLARSFDLETWEKPECGLPGCESTNIVLRGAGNAMDWGEFMPCRMLIQEDDPEPLRKWKMLYWDRPQADGIPGFCLAASQDGIHWRPIFQQPFITNANDAGSFIDRRASGPTQFGGSYYLYQQTWKHNPQLPQERDNLKGIHRRISIWTANRLDGRWIGPVTMLEPGEADPPDVQFYWLTPFHTKNGYGGFVHCHHTTDQSMDIQLVRSADGWSWERCLGGQPILGTGEPGSFDCGSVYAWGAPLIWKDRVLLFYNGLPTVHDGALRYPWAMQPGISAGIGLAEFEAGLLE